MTTGRKKEAVELVRPELAALSPYRSPAFRHRIKMDLNESPFDLPEQVKLDIAARMNGLLWQRYHDEFEEPLKEALAGYAGWPADGILIGNGSNELIFHSLLATVRPGETVLYPEPSFSLYRQNAVVVGGNPVGFDLQGPDFSVDPEKVTDLACRHKARAVVLCSPNNPTGNRIPNEIVDRISGALGSAVIVDEAYCQFAAGDAGALLKEHPNLVLLRTFSKAFGMAGLRFGFALCAPGLAREISKVQLPHHVNFFTQLAALAMLEQMELVTSRIVALKAERESLATELSKLPGLKVFPSEANFILVELSGRSPGEVFDSLLARGILVRNISNYRGLSRCLRLTVGLREDNEALVAALREVME